MTHYHSHKLPDFSTLLSGRIPPDDVGFVSERLQIWYNNTSEAWADPAPHIHAESDEVFIVLRGSIEIEVEGKRQRIGPREFCCFPAGVAHAVVAVYPPVETLMIRAPGGHDKVYVAGETHPRTEEREESDA